jgi:hypothetical protein
MALYLQSLFISTGVGSWIVGCPGSFSASLSSSSFPLSDLLSVLTCTFFFFFFCLLLFVVSFSAAASSASVLISVLTVTGFFLFYFYFFFLSFLSLSASVESVSMAWLFGVSSFFSLPPLSLVSLSSGFSISGLVVSLLSSSSAPNLRRRPGLHRRCRY